MEEKEQDVTQQLIVHLAFLGEQTYVCVAVVTARARESRLIADDTNVQSARAQ